MAKTATILFGILICFVATGGCLAGNMSALTLGVRYGTNDGTDKKTDLRRYDIFGVFDLPWRWQLASNLELNTQLTVSAGMLDGEGDSGFIGTLAPGLSLNDLTRRFFLELSGGLAVLPDYRMGSEDFGGPVQFIFDFGFGVRIFRHIGLGYRFQHFSDAALFGTDNRGVDMHMFELGYRYLRH